MILKDSTTTTVTRKKGKHKKSENSCQGQYTSNSFDNEKISLKVDSLIKNRAYGDCSDWEGSCDRSPSGNMGSSLVSYSAALSELWYLLAGSPATLFQLISGGLVRLKNCTSMIHTDRHKLDFESESGFGSSGRKKTDLMTSSLISSVQNAHLLLVVFTGTILTYLFLPMLYANLRKLISTSAGGSRNPFKAERNSEFRDYTSLRGGRMAATVYSKPQFSIRSFLSNNKSQRLSPPFPLIKVFTHFF